MCLTYLDIVYKSIYYIYRHTHNIIYTDIYTHINIYIISDNRLYVPFFDGGWGGLQYSSTARATGRSVRFTANVDCREDRSPRLVGLYIIYILHVSLVNKVSYRSMGTTGDLVPSGHRDGPDHHFTG